MNSIDLAQTITFIFIVLMPIGLVLLLIGYVFRALGFKKGILALLGVALVIFAIVQINNIMENSIDFVIDYSFENNPWILIIGILALVIAVVGQTIFHYYKKYKKALANNDTAWLEQFKQMLKSQFKQVGIAAGIFTIFLTLMYVFVFSRLFKPV